MIVKKSGKWNEVERLRVIESSNGSRWKVIEKFSKC